VAVAGPRLLLAEQALAAELRLLDVRLLVSALLSAWRTRQLMAT